MYVEQRLFSHVTSWVGKVRGGGKDPFKQAHAAVRTKTDKTGHEFSKVMP